MVINISISQQLTELQNGCLNQGILVVTRPSNEKYPEEQCENGKCEKDESSGFAPYIPESGIIPRMRTVEEMTGMKVQKLACLPCWNHVFFNKNFDPSSLF